MTRGLAALALALAPAAAAAQVAVGAAPDEGGLVLGRVCLDLDGDGRCGADEPGIAGARVLGEGGAVARADADGRFHLLALPGRWIGTDRSAYGGHTLVVEGTGTRRSFELAPGGAAAVELAVPAPPGARAPALSAGPGTPAGRGADGALRWSLAGRTEPGAEVAVGAAQARAGADGAFAVEVALAPGENRLAASISVPGAVAVYRWTIHLVRRDAGGDLVVPGEPERMGALAVVGSPLGGAVVFGALAPGVVLRAGGLRAGGGRVAAWVPPGAPAELLDDGVGAAVRVLAGAPRSAGLLGTTNVALGEVEISWARGAGALVTGRGAAAAEGTAGPFRLDAGVDLDDRDDRLSSLARPRDALGAEHALEPSRTFPTAGDEGADDDRNPGRGRLWARAEGEGARLDLGSTRAFLGPAELGRYDRAIFGGRIDVERDAGPVRVDAGAFGATLRADAGGNAPPRPAHDVLAAAGGAALWLSHGEVVPGTERVRLEWRDPATGLLAGTRLLARGTDYEIGWRTGQVVLAAPLASVRPPAAVLTGDPFAAPAARVVVDYLHAASGAAEEELAGGRVGAAIGPLSVSAHAASEERAADRWSLAGARAALDLGPWLQLGAEAARSRGLLFGAGGAASFARSDDGGLRFAALDAPGDAGALHLEASGGGGPVRAHAWWRERARGYSDGEFLEATAARERGATVAIGANGPLGLALQAAERSGGDPRDPAGLALLTDRRFLARGAWQKDRLGLVLEGVREEREEQTGTGEATSAGARASWRVDRAITLDVSHLQNVQLAGTARDPTFSSAGAAWSSGATSLGVRAGWGPVLGPRVLVGGTRVAPGEAIYGTFGADPDAPAVLGGEASALGVRQRTGDAEVFTEERYGRDLFGARQGRVLGATVRPLEGLFVTVSGERGERLRLDDSVVARTAAAASAGLVRGPVRLSARGELRREDRDGSAAAGGAAEWIVARGTSLAARASWTRGTSSGVEALGLDASLGAAWRSARASALASAARFVEQRPGADRRDGVLLRAAATAAPVARLTLGVAAALALQRVADVEDDRLSGSARAQARIAGPVDVAAEYARRAPLSGERLGALDALRAEAGVATGEARLALGYNLLGFGGDGLSPARDTGRVYVRAQVAY
ncbi:MAG TPA: hypothetical protein VF875_06165 [Anaeromyxobacter sp.]